MTFTVSRDGQTLVTLHEGTDTTARDEATAELATVLESLVSEGEISDWAIDDADVYEHPTAPFEPYTIEVGFAVSVVVDVDDADRAAAVGTDAIDDALANAGVDGVTYTSQPATSAA
ncbi:hypothetical protein [Natrarchaeobius oligotrophus]|uniref:Uncharacterized protein n=1 Tax=Natrarchaeobius chitinivorans TaxID=1679083 RepID=A0A3N6MME2_NATCH|nr:hypothetical protein [Natrarchaeobius chitinivorans]RQG98570.1 hypothetical protein EA472_17355 [Natrarchaeobius chitinivorans]